MTHPTIPETIALVRGAHAGQTDLCGEPYHLHCEAVCRILVERWPDAPEFAQHAALLHDVLEDTKLSAAALERFGYEPATIKIVMALTKQPGANYLRRIGEIAAKRDPWTIRVKLADLAHNTDAERARAVRIRFALYHLDGSDVGRQRAAEREARYEEAKRILNEALQSCP